jgi:hypothetical protein
MAVQPGVIGFPATLPNPSGLPGTYTPLPFPQPVPPTDASIGAINYPPAVIPLPLAQGQPAGNIQGAGPLNIQKLQETLLSLASGQPIPPPTIPGGILII